MKIGNEDINEGDEHEHFCHKCLRKTKHKVFYIPPNCGCKCDIKCQCQNCVPGELRYCSPRGDTME